MDKRIAYYTKKVALYGDRSTSKGKNQYRYDRLMLYKGIMHRRIFKGVRA